MPGKGWVKARELEVGDMFFGLDGTYGVLLETSREEHREGVWVYNLRVEGTHTYFVHEQGVDAEAVWVHNAEYDFSEELSCSKGTARQRLNDALGSTVGDGQAGHHIVPLEAIDDARTSELLAAAASGGFNINGANNGVLLDRLFHSGGHPLFNERMIQSIAEIDESLEDAEVASQLQAIVDSQRTFLLSVQSTRLQAFQSGLRGRIYLK